MTAADRTRSALRVPRMRLIAATLAAKRAQYSELRCVPTFASLEALADAEDIVLRSAPLPENMLGRARFMGGVGIVTIADDLDDATRLIVTLHELGHIWLGHCDHPVLNRWTEEEVGPWRDCRRQSSVLIAREEDESNMFTAAMLGTSHASILAAIAAVFRARRPIPEPRAA